MLLPHRSILTVPGRCILTVPGCVSTPPDPPGTSQHPGIGSDDGLHCGGGGGQVPARAMGWKKGPGSAAPVQRVGKGSAAHPYIDPGGGGGRGRGGAGLGRTPGSLSPGWGGGEPLV